MGMKSINRKTPTPMTEPSTYPIPLNIFLAPSARTVAVRSLIRCLIVSSASCAVKPFPLRNMLTCFTSSPHMIFERASATARSGSSCPGNRVGAPCDGVGARDTATDGAAAVGAAICGAILTAVATCGAAAATRMAAVGAACAGGRAGIAGIVIRCAINEFAADVPSAPQTGHVTEPDGKLPEGSTSKAYLWPQLLCIFTPIIGGDGLCAP